MKFRDSFNIGSEEIVNWKIPDKVVSKRLAAHCFSMRNQILFYDQFNSCRPCCGFLPGIFIFFCRDST